MRKIVIVSSFLLTVLAVFLVVIVQIMASNKAEIDRIAPSTEELREQAEKLGPLRLAEKDVEDICLQLKKELETLNYLMWGLAISIILLALIMLFAFIRLNRKMMRFDGLILLLITPLLHVVYPLVYTFSCAYYNESNASMVTRLALIFGNFIVSPLLFYAAYRMNTSELRLQLHSQKWVSYVAIALTIISLLTAITLGLGALFTPDVSSFTS